MEVSSMNSTVSNKNSGPQMNEDNPQLLQHKPQLNLTSSEKGTRLNSFTNNNITKNGVERTPVMTHNDHNNILNNAPTNEPPNTAPCEMSQNAGISCTDPASLPDTDPATIEAVLEGIVAKVSNSIDLPLSSEEEPEHSTKDQVTHVGDNEADELGSDDNTCDLVIDSALPPGSTQEGATDSAQKATPIIPNKSPSLISNGSATIKAAKSPETNDIPEKINEKPNEAHPEECTRSINLQSIVGEVLPAEGPSKQVAFSSHTETEVVAAEHSALDSGATPINHIEELDELTENKTKDMVMLRNLEITPPPLPAAEEAGIKEESDAKEHIPTKSGPTSTKRKRSTTVDSTADHDETPDSGSRSKRRRTQTKLFQVGEYERTDEFITHRASPVKQRSKTAQLSGRHRKKSSTSESNLSTAQDIEMRPAQDLQDVIFYEKNDYLAIRNEENSFYLCQLAENVRVKRPSIKVKWLDTSDGGKTYFVTSHYDKVPQRSIIMPVILNKLKSTKKSAQLFTLDDHDRDNVMERLKRSLNAPTEPSSSQVV